MRPRHPHGHFYSPYASPEDIAWASSHRTDPIGYDLNADAQRLLVRELDLRFPATARYEPDNEMFHPVDAALLWAILVQFQPKRVVEVGSGHSTAVMLDAIDDGAWTGDVVSIEPYADRLRGVLRPGDPVEIHERRVQEIPSERLVEFVGEDGILFIDSSHVLKAGSDVRHLLLDTVPLLPVGTIVHIHDIPFSTEYFDAWLEEGRQWNEAQFVHAFLQGNQDWEILAFAQWLQGSSPELFSPTFDEFGLGGTSLWLRRVADVDRDRNSSAGLSTI